MLLCVRSFNFSFRLFSSWLFYVAFINGTFALAALAFTRTMISAPFLVMTPVPIAIGMPFIIALKFRSVP
jgi:hypothetical protein